MSQSFYIPADDDRQVIADRIWMVIQKLPPKRHKVEITEAKSIRSEQQNRYLWGVVYPKILEAGKLEGWTADDLHEYLLGEHFGWEVVTGFGRKRMRPIRRSSRLGKLEFVDYVAFIQQRMAEHGIYVPDPNEQT